MASALAILVWAIAVPGSDVIEVERTVSVDILDLPAGYELIAVEPAEVQVTLSGPRRDVLALDEGELRAHVNAVLLELGRRTFPIGSDQISHPPRTEIVDVSPDSVRISLRSTSAEAR